jgi:putative phosphoribosyl transferase
MMFASREDAGQRLGDHLKRLGVQADVVLGLPRGGLVVAAEVARVLRTPLDVLIVRKIGHPFHREFAVGALAEKGVIVLDEGLAQDNPAVRAELDEVVREETRRLHSYEARFHRGGSLPVADRRVLLVDDGLATGATTQAAALSVRNQGASRVIVGAPVASRNAVERLKSLADETIVLCVDPDFEAVGRYYDIFPQTTDSEVLELLKAA